jgi:hypothetical protein
MEYSTHEPCFCFAPLAIESARLNLAQALPDSIGPLAIEIPVVSDALIAGNDFLLDSVAGLA